MGSLLLCVIYPTQANPRNPLPETPSQVWQNDLDLRDMIQNRISINSNSICIGDPILCVDTVNDEVNISGDLNVSKPENVQRTILIENSNTTSPTNTASTLQLKNLSTTIIGSLLLIKYANGFSGTWANSSILRDNSWGFATAGDSMDRGVFDIANSVEGLYINGNGSGDTGFIRFPRSGEQILGSSGTVSAPMYSYERDVNTGHYLPNDGNLCASTNGTEAWCISSSQEITQPLQPSFLVTDGTSQSNVTGDGTAHTVTWATEVYDQNNDFASNTFTSPATGRYSLCAAAILSGYVADNTATQIRIITSNRNYISETPDIGSSTILSVDLCTIADMDANDTATIVVIVSGVTQGVDTGLDVTETFFAGTLLN